MPSIELRLRGVKDEWFTDTFAIESICVATENVCTCGQIAKGQKFERAHVWNVPVVNRFWLDACAAQARAAAVSCLVGKVVVVHL